MGIFGKPFKKNESISEVLTDDEKIKNDMKTVNKLSDQLSTFGSVLIFIDDNFLVSIYILTQENYPVVSMEKISEEKISEDDKYLSNWHKESVELGCVYIVEAPNMFLERFYTYDGAMLYIKKYYEIREKHLKELFPND